MHYDRHTGQWIGKSKLPADDGRKIQCPKCGQMVPWSTRNNHPCLMRAVKGYREDPLEFEISMLVASFDARRSWNQYGI